MSQACLGKSTLNIGHSQYGQLTAVKKWIATDQYPMTISQAHVSTHRDDVIYLEAVRSPAHCFTRSRTMFIIILLASLGAKENPRKLIMHTYWTSMF